MAKQQPKKAPAKQAPAKKQAPGRKGPAVKKATATRKVAAKRTAAKKAAPARAGARRSAPKKAAVKKTAATRTAAKKAAPKRAVGKRTVSKRVAPKKAVRRSTTVRASATNAAPSRVVERALDHARTTPTWPDAVEAGHDVHVHIGTDHRGKAPRAQLHAVHGSPNELHPGTTRKTGKSHDRPGSQLERKRHQYPSSNVPNRGSAHTTQVKGKRRNDAPPSSE